MPDVFGWCSSLTAVNAHPQSENYTSVDGVLFSKDMTRLVLYPQGKTAKTYTIPSSVTEIGDSAFYSCENLTSVTLPSGLLTIGDYAFNSCYSLSSVSFPYGLTEIGSSAFSYTGLTSVTIPDTVTDAGDFIDCTNLKSVTLPDSLEWMPSFSGCVSLTEVNIPDGVTDIYNNAFMDCVSLKSIDLPEGLEYIGDYAFYGCKSLTTIHIPSTVTQIISLCTFAACTSLESITVAAGNENYCSVNGVLFDKDKITLLQYPPAKTTKNYTIPSTVTNLAMSSFEGCSYLEKVTIPASLEYPGSYTFADCPSLKSFVVDSGSEFFCAVDGILFTKDKTGLVAYPAAKSGTSYQVPDGVDFIYDLAFSASKLTSISLPASIGEYTDIGSMGCTNIKEVNIAPANTLYTSVDGIVFSKDKKTLIYYPVGKTASSYTVPSYVTTIGDWAFYMVPGLTDIVVSEGVTTINDYAFRECPRLSSVTLPGSLTYIGDYVAVDSPSLSDIYYHGNADEWNNINIMNSNDELLSADIHYILNKLTDTDCTKQGSAYHFSIACTQPLTDEFLAVALYSTDGTLLGFKTVSCNGSADYATALPASDNAGYARVFVWDSTGSMTPLGEPEDVEL